MEEGIRDGRIRIESCNGSRSYDVQNKAKHGRVTCSNDVVMEIHHDLRQYRKNHVMMKEKKEDRRSLGKEMNGTM